jgi:hypothetical protein
MFGSGGALSNNGSSVSYVLEWVEELLILYEEYEEGE